MDGAHGKGDAHETYPSHFCPHYPYASWQCDRELDDDANHYDYFDNKLCTIGERRANPQAERSSVAKRSATATTFKSVCEDGETVVGSAPYSGTKGVGFQHLSVGPHFQFFVGSQLRSSEGFQFWFCEGSAC